MTMTGSIRRGVLALAVMAGFGTIAPSRADDMTAYALINRAAATQPIVAHPLRGGVTELEGSGGNIGVYAGPSGLFMVDAGIAVSRKKIEAALRKIESTKIRYVVNTHW